jgi:hypothetical protein
MILLISLLNVMIPRDLQGNSEQLAGAADVMLKTSTKKRFVGEL